MVIEKEHKRSTKHKTETMVQLWEPSFRVLKAGGRAKEEQNGAVLGKKKMSACVSLEGRWHELTLFLQSVSPDIAFASRLS